MAKSPSDRLHPLGVKAGRIDDNWTGIAAPSHVSEYVDKLDLGHRIAHFVECRQRKHDGGDSIAVAAASEKAGLEHDEIRMPR